MSEKLPTQNRRLILFTLLWLFWITAFVYLSHCA